MTTQIALGTVQEEITRQRDMLLEALANHILQGLLGIYSMRRPESNTYSVFMTELGGRIVITGDTVIGVNGVISMPGYDLEWLRASSDSPTYMAEKFLRRGYDPMRAKIEIREMIQDYEEGGHRYSVTHEVYKGLREIADDGDYSEFVVVSRLSGLDMYESMPGYGYNIVDTGNLWAVALTFKRLWEAL